MAIFDQNAIHSTKHTCKIQTNGPMDIKWAENNPYEILFVMKHVPISFFSKIMVQGPPISIMGQKRRVKTQYAAIESL